MGRMTAPYRHPQDLPAWQRLLERVTCALTDGHRYRTLTLSVPTPWCVWCGKPTPREDEQQ